MLNWMCLNNGIQLKRFPRSPSGSDHHHCRHCGGFEPYEVSSVQTAFGGVDFLARSFDYFTDFPGKRVFGAENRKNRVYGVGDTDPGLCRALPREEHRKL